MKSKTPPISLVDVTKSDLKFLYSLLKQRESIVNISHQKMPSYKDHVKFVLSNPYSKWYVIKSENKKIGSAYISNLNEIAIHLKKEMKTKKLETEILMLMMKNNPKPRYLANVSPKNKKLIEFFKNNGFKLIQHTYELREK